MNHSLAERTVDDEDINYGSWAARTFPPLFPSPGTEVNVVLLARVVWRNKQVVV